MDDPSKLRPLYLLKILYEETDESHPLSTAELIRTLDDRFGIKAYRTTVTRDISQLTEFGIDICTIRSTQNKYYISGRIFELPELKLLVDAVEFSKFITEKKSRELIRKLSCFTSRYRADDLRRCLCADGSVKQVNEKVYYIVDTLNEAIMREKKVAFVYFQYDEFKKKKLKHGGEEYILSPYRLVWNGDHYYIVGYSESHGKIGTFRVDRIDRPPRILAEPAKPLPRDFDIVEHIHTMFRMFEGRREKVVLLCEGDLMNVVVDNFGEDVDASPTGDGRARVEVQVALTPIFYRWVFGFGGKIRIIAPKEVKAEYAALVKKALASLDD